MSGQRPDWFRGFFGLGSLVSPGRSGTGRGLFSGWGLLSSGGGLMRMFGGGGWFGRLFGGGGPEGEDRFAKWVTAAVHILILVLAVLYRVTLSPDERPAYIEVTLGEFQSGAPAERAEQMEQEVETRPEQPRPEPEDPAEVVPEEVVEPVQEVLEEVKPVDLPDQPELEAGEEIESPETEIIDQNVTDQPQEQAPSEVPEAVVGTVPQEGVPESGDEAGDVGEMNVEQGTGRTEESSSPYDLQWEGLERNPMVQPLPVNPVNEEAIVRFRFQVNPDGSIGRIIPLIKGNPELEREVQRTLRSWKFSRLPASAPQEAQWGTITFRFVLD